MEDNIVPILYKEFLYTKTINECDWDIYRIHDGNSETVSYMGRYEVEKIAVYGDTEEELYKNIEELDIFPPSPEPDPEPAPEEETPELESKEVEEEVSE